MKKIGVIGANSYIARNLYYILRHSDEEYEINLYDYNDSFRDGDYDTYKKVDITDKQSVKYIDFSCDILFLFSGKTGTLSGFDEYETFINVNEIGLLNLLTEYHLQNSAAKIIFPSTRLVYKGSCTPLKEGSEKEFKTIYAVNKFACENYLRQFNSIFGVKYAVFRICVPYGTLIKGASSYGTAEFMLNKAQNGHNISLYGDGSVRRTITHISDLCNILILGALNSSCINDVYNIGGEDYSMLEMAEEIARRYGVQVETTPWPDKALMIESGCTVFDDEKLQKIVGYSYSYHFKEW